MQYLGPNLHSGKRLGKIEIVSPPMPEICNLLPMPTFSSVTLPLHDVNDTY